MVSAGLEGVASWWTGASKVQMMAKVLLLALPNGSQHKTSQKAQNRLVKEYTLNQF